MRRELLIGCGNKREKHLTWPEVPPVWQNLTTLDIDLDCKADVIHDLNVLPYPFEDESFDEIHAYEVLEHCGRQGDWRFFFAQFAEFHRILKPGGWFAATVPMWDSPWAWGDPGHTRVITKGSLAFLDRRGYEQVGSTSMTDYRSVWPYSFETAAGKETEFTMGFVLQKA